MKRVKQNRYDLMESQEIEGDKFVWADCLSINLDTFPASKVKKNVLIRQGDVIRPDLFFYSEMDTNNLEDITLWLNNIPSRRDMIAGKTMQLPSTTDINSFYIKNRKIN